VNAISADLAAAAVSKQKKILRVKKNFNVTVNEKLCKGCYFCIRFCPMGVFVRSDVIGELGYDIVKVEFPEKCNGCKACLLYCPDLAIAVAEAEGSDHKT